MKEDNKYYQPTIEEFHVGFEYEYNNNHCWMHEPTKGEWWKEEFTNGTGQDGESDFQEISNMIDNEEIRVKHLDREDIESFGFKQITDECFNLDIDHFRGRDKQELRILIRRTVLIYLAIDEKYADTESTTLFTGTIKNRSELKRVLAQIGAI